MKNFDELLKPKDPAKEPVPIETRRPELALAEPPRELNADKAQSLLTKQQTDELRSRWDAIQTSFIDEPRRAVSDAEALVASATRQITEAFAVQKGQLEKQWNRDGETSTEELRIALRQYRSFFSRLLEL